MTSQKRSELAALENGKLGDAHIAKNTIPTTHITSVGVAPSNSFDIDVKKGAVRFISGLRLACFDAAGNIALRLTYASRMEHSPVKT